jgi:RND superfamily putative drug exporter
MLVAVVWERLSAIVTGRRSWLLALMIVVVSTAVMALSGGNSSTSQSPISVPSGSDSAKAATTLNQFPGGDRVSAILVITRSDGSPLRSADLIAAEQARDRMQQVPQALPGSASPVMTSADGKAAIVTVSLSAALSGLALNDAVKALRFAAGDDLPSALTGYATGRPAFAADIANAFSGANITLLVVTALVVALLLVATYRSPVLWLVPLTVIGLADRVATVVGAGVAPATGVTFDGATSGITSVLVFGAGTNYALLLISRYREELRNDAEHRAALRRAVRAAGPAIVASNATMVLALLTLILATIPSTRSLGICGACGLVVAAIFVLVLLQPLLGLCGRRVFWPFVPRVGDPQTTATGRLAPCRGRRRPPARPRVCRCGHGIGRVGGGTARNTYRTVTDLAVPHPGRFGSGFQHAGCALSRRDVRSDRRDRLECRSSTSATGHNLVCRCRFGYAGGSVVQRIDKMVSSHRCGAINYSGVQCRWRAARVAPSNRSEGIGGWRGCASTRYR